MTNSFPKLRSSGMWVRGVQGPHENPRHAGYSDVYRIDQCTHAFDVHTHQPRGLLVLRHGADRKARPGKVQEDEKQNGQHQGKDKTRYPNDRYGNAHDVPDTFEQMRIHRLGGIAECRQTDAEYYRISSTSEDQGHQGGRSG